MKFVSTNVLRLSCLAALQAAASANSTLDVRATITPFTPSPSLDPDTLVPPTFSGYVPVIVDVAPKFTYGWDSALSVWFAKLGPANLAFMYFADDVVDPTQIIVGVFVKGGDDDFLWGSYLLDQPRQFAAEWDAAPVTDVLYTIAQNFL